MNFRTPAAATSAATWISCSLDIELIDLPPEIQHCFLSRKASVLPRLKIELLLFNKCFGLLRGSEDPND